MRTRPILPKLLLWLCSVNGLATPIATRSKLVARLQNCVTPEQALERVAPHLATFIDSDGALASLLLVRLSRQLAARDNARRRNQNDPPPKLLTSKHQEHVRRSAACLAEGSDISPNLEAVTEGTKAYAAVLRLLGSKVTVEDPLIQFWSSPDSALVSSLEPHHLSGITWAFDTFRLLNMNARFNESLQRAYNDLNLPFRVIPGCMNEIHDLSVEALRSEVNFRADDIRTPSNKLVKERRETAWQGDSSCGPFLYSKKSMPRSDWSPLVAGIRDHLFRTSSEYYDGCLLNLYPNGQSGMRYHIDPDQGTLWDYSTAVVSVGATRRFTFRSLMAEQQPHSFVVMHGDVTHMFGDCQERYQHSVKKADFRNDDSARASLVFKRTWNYDKTAKTK